MKNFELKPTEENLLLTYQKDTIDRNSDVHAFVDILNSLEDSCSIALDGLWGSGKTFFVKQVKMILDSCASVQPKGNYATEIKSVWQNYHNGQEPEFQTQLCVYYDAWENDNDGDPVLSLVYSILQDVDTETPFPKDAKILEKAAAVIECISGRNATTLLDSMKSDDLLDDLRKSKDTHTVIADFLDHLLDERADRLVVIIDELDRCKPDYAVQLLEKIKHYFDNERITFVFAVNLQELQHTISNYYGNAFDSCRYLDRFFDLRISLPPANMYRYYQSINFQSNYYTVDLVCKKIIELFHFSLREISRYLKAIKIAEYELTHSDGNFSFSDPEGLATQFCTLYIVPLLIALEISDVTSYNQLISGRNPEKLIELLECMNSNYKGHFRELLSRNEIYNTAPESEQQGKEIVTIKEKAVAAYKAIFVKDYTSYDYRCFVGNCEFNAKTKTFLLRLVSLLSKYSKYE